MFHRLLKTPKNNSFFIFGPRGTGKTTFLKQLFAKDKILWIDLLNPEIEDRYARSPQTLNHEIQAAKGEIFWVVIDEIQKLPKLLDSAHWHIENSGLKFVLTGSSARKLRRGAANLLAGRAFVRHLFPLTSREMSEAFNLDEALRWGTLPKTAQLKFDQDKTDFLKAYALTYLKEEVWAEHIVRQLDPFRKFLELAAHANGQIINYSNIAQEAGVDTKTIQSYFEILEDTLLGLSLSPYHRSVRRRLRKNPKFYFFDPGVKRSLEHALNQPLTPGSDAYGKAFEHWVILEAWRLNAYLGKDFQFFYLRTKDDAEIDLIVERPGLPKALIEIKSADRVDHRDTRTLERFVKDFGRAEAFCFSRDPVPKKIGAVWALPWNRGLEEIGLT